MTYEQKSYLERLGEDLITNGLNYIAYGVAAVVVGSVIVCAVRSLR